MTSELLYSRILHKGTMLCVGLDTDVRKIPECVRQGRTAPEAVLEFNKRIIDATQPYCVAYNHDVAFYERHGPDGQRVRDKTLEYLRTN